MIIADRCKIAVRILNFMDEYIKIGTITQPFGIKGEMKVYPHTDDPGRFKRLKKVFIKNGESFAEYESQSAKLSLPLVILKLKGIETPEEIRPLRQKDLYVLREDAVPLNDGEYYSADIIGMDVVDDEGIERGKITDIIQTGANDVYEITGNGKVFLLPAIKQCILNVDVAAKKMTIHILEGLLD